MDFEFTARDGLAGSEPWRGRRADWAGKIDDRLRPVVETFGHSLVAKRTAHAFSKCGEAYLPCASQIGPLSAASGLCILSGASSASSIDELSGEMFERRIGAKVVLVEKIGVHHGHGILILSGRVVVHADQLVLVIFVDRLALLRS